LKGDQNLDTPENEKYSNVEKDYKTQVKGEPYITAELDYGKMKTFRIGDGKYYSRSARRKRRATGIVFKFNISNTLILNSLSFFHIFFSSA